MADDSKKAETIQLIIGSLRSAQRLRVYMSRAFEPCNARCPENALYYSILHGREHGRFARFFS
jgi:hypothetical protein